MNGAHRSVPAGVIPGMAATFLGVGLARFSYTALLPELIHQGWFSESEAAYLGASNLVGYALGALAAAPVSARLGPARVVMACAMWVVISFVVCAWPVSFPLFMASRFVSGACGAALMVLVPSLALMSLPPERRARGAAWVFTGVGLGILLSGTLVPWWATVNLSMAWLGLAIFGALAWWLIRSRWPEENPADATVEPTQERASTGIGVVVFSIIFAYAMDATGFVPHTLFWVDYLQRHVGLSVSASALQWTLFGVGAVCGPFLVAYVGRWASWHFLLVGGLTVKGLAVLIPVLSHSLLWLALSSVLVGALVPGMVAIVSARLSELTTPAGHARLWGLATATFAWAQGVSATGFAWLYDGVTAGEEWMFAVGGAVLLIAAFSVTCLSRNQSAIAAAKRTIP